MVGAESKAGGSQAAVVACRKRTNSREVQIKLLRGRFMRAAAERSIAGHARGMLWSHRCARMRLGSLMRPGRKCARSSRLQICYQSSHNGTLTWTRTVHPAQLFEAAIHPSVKKLSFPIVSPTRKIDAQE